MSEKERPKLTLVANNDRGEHQNIEAIERAHDHEQLIYTYGCTTDAKPEWCVWGNDGKGGKDVLFWIRPAEEAKWVGERIARYLNDHNAVTGATVEMTEWNPRLRGTPVYERSDDDGEDPPPLAA